MSKRTIAETFRGFTLGETVYSGSHGVRGIIGDIAPDSVRVDLYEGYAAGAMFALTFRESEFYPGLIVIDNKMPEYCGEWLRGHYADIGYCTLQIIPRFPDDTPMITYLGGVEGYTLSRGYETARFRYIWNAFRLPGVTSLGDIETLNEVYPALNETGGDRWIRVTDSRLLSAFADWEYDSGETIDDLLDTAFQNAGYTDDALTSAYRTLRKPPAWYGGYLKFAYESESDTAFVSYLPDNRPVTGGNGYTSSGRMRMKVGKFLRKIAPDANAVDIEKMSNRIKGVMKESVINCAIWSGEDVLRGYHVDNYSPRRNGDLDNSCMRYDYAQPYVQWYAENPDTVALIVAIDGEERVHGRTLLWTNEDGERFHDRIYGSDSTQSMISAWCRDNGISSHDCPSGLHMRRTTNGYYPYMDTYRYAVIDDSSDTLTLYADSPNSGYVRYLELCSTSGGSSEYGGVECSECGCFIDPDDMVCTGYHTFCPDCALTCICVHCGERAYDTYGDAATPLCSECASEYVCDECGEYTPDGTVWHSIADADMCETCHDTRCYLCGERGGTDSTLCPDCAAVTPCAECAAPRVKGTTGDYCPACTPVNLTLPGMPASSTWGYNPAGYFVSLHGVRVYDPSNSGLTGGPYRMRYPSYRGVTWVEVYATREPLPGYEGMVWRHAQYVPVALPGDGD